MATTSAPPTPSTPEEKQTVFLSMFKVLDVLGKGSMGTIFLVQGVNNPNCPFAMKIVHKSKNLIKFNFERRARWEIEVLKHLEHPLLPKLMDTIDTKDLLGWGLPYYPCGDFRELLNHQQKISDELHIQFYAAEIFSALEYLHSKQIVYRDLKPENILIQQTGHIALIDFELSRELKRKKLRPLPIQCTVTSKNNCSGGLGVAISPCMRPSRTWKLHKGIESCTFVGTEAYIAPEVIRGDTYDFGIDWWAFGVLMYEMVYGTQPFDGNDRREKFNSILQDQVDWKGRDKGDAVMIDLIKRLLVKDPKNRLGHNGNAEEIKKHKFFNGLKWDTLTQNLPPRLEAPGDPNALKKEPADDGFRILREFGIKVDEKQKKLLEEWSAFRAKGHKQTRRKDSDSSS